MFNMTAAFDRGSQWSKPSAVQQLGISPSHSSSSCTDCRLNFPRSRESKSSGSFLEQWLRIEPIQIGKIIRKNRKLLCNWNCQILFKAKEIEFTDE